MLSSQEPLTPLIDSTMLKNLLANEQWREADLETLRLILELTGRTTEGWLRTEDVIHCPKAGLQAIDALWMQFSQAQFGLAMQQSIWHNVGENYTEFGEKVGWHCADNWLEYDDLNFSKQAPAGHLPALMMPIPLPNGDRIRSFVLGKWRTVLLSRRDLDLSRSFDPL